MTSPLSTTAASPRKPSATVPGFFAIQESENSARLGRLTYGKASPLDGHVYFKKPDEGPRLDAFDDDTQYVEIAVDLLQSADETTNKKSHGPASSNTTVCSRLHGYCFRFPRISVIVKEIQR